jgi:bifunctional pyridoxal-dependent enzyme with beta-cystathionase and maltose regulon repressor activities
MSGLNAQLDSIRQSPAVAITDRVAVLKVSGRKVIGLHVADPDFATPPAVLEAALEAMREGRTHYASELQDVFQNLPVSLVMRYEVMEIGVAFVAIGMALATLAVLFSLVWHPLP